MRQFLLGVSALITLTMLLANTAIAKDSMAAGYPIYREESKVLVVPRIDTLERIGAYHGSVFFYDEQTNVWHLAEPNSRPESSVSIDEVTITVTDTFPTQVFLHVTGENFLCAERSLIDQGLKNNIFEIRVYVLGSNPHLIDFSCEKPIGQFVRIIPLSVYGLDAGIYEYKVNDEYHGTFNLFEDNRFIE